MSKGIRASGERIFLAFASWENKKQECMWESARMMGDRCLSSYFKSLTFLNSNIARRIPVVKKGGKKKACRVQGGAARGAHVQLNLVEQLKWFSSVWTLYPKL